MQLVAQGPEAVVLAAQMVAEITVSVEAAAIAAPTASRSTWPSVSRLTLRTR